ncbi:MAG: hypothetical protein ACPGPS_18980, partial [Rubripirellula sp.]
PVSQRVIIPAISQPIAASEWTMPTPRLALLLLAFASLSIGSITAQTTDSTSSDQTVASDPASEPESAEAATGASTGSPDENLPESPASAPAETATEEAEELEASLAAQIDKAFGSWVVTPFATVLFFDFYTGPRTKEVTDEFGNTVLDPATGAPLKELTRQGWLRTEANPDGISIPFVVIWLLAGAVFLTLRMGFINIRACD